MTSRNSAPTRGNDRPDLGGAQKGAPKSQQVERLQAEVDEVAAILHTSVDKLLERGEKIDDLMDNADDLLARASSFQTTTKAVRRHYQWKNKMFIVIGLIVALLLVAVIVLAILRPWENAHGDSGGVTMAYD